MTQLAEFTLGDKLGEGLDGVVYRAVGPTGVAFAVKVVRTAAIASLASVTREIEALSALDHPGIVQIHAYGVGRSPQTGADSPWYAMELIEGPSWGDALRGASEQRVLDSAHRLCDALAWLHSHGVIHGDIKPANIRMRSDTEPVLIDFGMTRTFAGRDDLQLSALASGTAAYMAPEAVRGELLDARADLWSLGILLYTTLHGELPFRTVRDILDSDVRPRSSKSPGWNKLFRRLLQREPAQRIGHASEVARHLVEMGATPRLPATQAPAYLYRPSLHGRDATLRKIGTQIADRLRDDRGGVWVLAGPSGIGKTRLATELGRGFSRSGVRVAAARSRPPSQGEPDPFGVVSQWLDMLIEQNWIPRLRRDGAVLSAIVPRLVQRYGSPSPLPNDAAHDRLHAAVIAAIVAATESGPLLLAVDNLQWLHPVSVRVLTRLCEVATEHPLVLITTARTEEPSDAVRSAVDAGAVEVVLPPLKRRDVESVIADMLGTDQPPAALAEGLVAHTGGNPLFVAEALRASLTRGLLTRDEVGRWSCAPAVDLAASGFPSSVRELLTIRVHALTPRHRMLTAAAAILGHEFAESDLAKLTPDLYSGDALSALLRAQVLLCPSPGGLIFEHDLVGEIALDTLDPEHRRALHEAAADLLEPRTGAEPSLWSTVAHHLQRAELPAREAQARRRSAEAALDRSTASFAHARAQLVRALELEPDHLSTRLALAERVLIPQGAATDVLELLADVDQNDPRPLRVRATARRLAGDLDAARAGLAKALTVAQNPEERARVYNELGNVENIAGRTDTALERHAEALKIARLQGDERGAAQSLNNMGMAHWKRGEHDDARRCYDSALNYQLSCGDELGRAATLLNIGLLHLAQDQLDVVGELLRESLVIFQQLGTRSGQARVVLNLGIVASRMGNWAEAEKLFHEAEDTFVALRDEPMQRSVLSNLVFHLVARGDGRRAVETGGRALEIARRLDGPVDLGFSLCGYAAGLRLCGRIDEARQTLTEAQTIAATTSRPRLVELCEEEADALARLDP